MPSENHAELLPRVVENLHTVVILLDQDLRIRFLNPAAEMLFAISAKRLIGTRLEEVLLGNDLLNDLAEALESGHPFTRRELPLKLLPGKQITVDLTAIPLLDPQRERELLVELNEVDRQLRIIKEENLLAQGEASRALVRGLAHEIKNPLGGLRGAAQLLERELHNEELKEYTQIIISEADRLQQLMDRMLGPNSLPRRTWINIHEVLEHVRQVMQVGAPAGLVLWRDYDPSIPELLADRDQLVQALMNLVRNAVQAAGENGEVVLKTRILRQFTIGHTLYKLVIKVDVIDNGPGIPDAMKESIFLPMVTGRAEGTGLGLPIAQSLINQNGGLIECNSQPGQTVFSILLPVSEADED